MSKRHGGSWDYPAERLVNGYVLVRSRNSGLQGLWNSDGTPRHGDLTRSNVANDISRMVADEFGQEAAS